MNEYRDVMTVGIPLGPNERLRPGEVVMFVPDSCAWLGRRAIGAVIAAHADEDGERILVRVGIYHHIEELPDASLDGIRVEGVRP